METPYKVFVAIAALAIITACTSTTDAPKEPAVYDPTPYVLDRQLLPQGPPLPANVTLTQQTVLLGKMLFHEKMLSKDNSQACVDCHLQRDAFTDARRFSVGVEGKEGGRQAMTIFNVAWMRPAGGPGVARGFFWDGRAATLREQSLMPIQDPLEMNETLENCVAKLSASEKYRDQFIRAFGDDTVTSERMGIAMEQFMFSIVSGNSKFDRVAASTAAYTPEEQRGRDLYFSEMDPDNNLRGAECFHCHNGPNFTNDGFMNNGLDAEADFTDLGRFDVTGNPQDRARFKVTSLRNIEKSSPFMHDGRFTTLEEVVDHYNTGVKPSSTVDNQLRLNLRPGGLGLTEQEKSDLIAFLKTLTDETLFTNPEYQP